jgi:hypothetical protein
VAVIAARIIDGCPEIKGFGIAIGHVGVKLLNDGDAGNPNA